jgi:hypothetical protein
MTFTLIWWNYSIPAWSMLAATEPQRRSSSSSRSSDEDTTSGSRRRAGKGKAAWTMGSAAGQLQELLGRALESVSALKPTETSWAQAWQAAMAAGVVEAFLRPEARIVPADRSGLSQRVVPGDREPGRGLPHFELSVAPDGQRLRLPAQRPPAPGSWSASWRKPRTSTTTPHRCTAHPPSSNNSSSIRAYPQGRPS